MSPYPWVCLSTQYPPQSARSTLCTTVPSEWIKIFTQLVQTSSTCPQHHGYLCSDPLLSGELRQVYVNCSCTFELQCRSEKSADVTCPGNAPCCCWQRCWDICPLQHTRPWRDAFVPPLSDLNRSCHTAWGTAEKPGQMFQFPCIHSFDCIRLDRISPLALPRGNVKWVMKLSTLQCTYLMLRKP